MKNFSRVGAYSMLSLMTWSCASARLRPEASDAAGAERILFIEGQAGRLRVSDGGSGDPAVIFLHGLGNDLESWDAQLDHVRAKRRAIAFDQRGHGESERARDGVYTIEALAEDLDAVVNALSIERFYLVGHSMSGAVLTTYASAHPEKILGLVYADAFADCHAIPRETLEAIMKREAAPSFGKKEIRESFMEMLADSRPSTRERVLNAVEKLDPPAFAALRKGLFTITDARPLLARTTAPRLSIEAENNPFPTTLISAIDPTATKKALPEVSHWLMMDNPNAFNRALDPFIGLPGSGL